MTFNVIGGYFYSAHYISTIDFVIFPIYLFLLLIIYFRTFSKDFENLDDLRRKFIFGYFAKAAGVFAFSMIYLYYYKGGDSINYFDNANAMANMLFYDFKTFVSIVGGNLSQENYSMFDSNTGYLHYYMFKDEKTFTVSRYTVPLVFLGFRSFLITGLIISQLSYIAVWKFYIMVRKYTGNRSFTFFVTVVVFPSTIFWGSGIMKDTFTFAASCMLAYCFDKLFISKTWSMRHLLVSIFSVFLIITIKPYILIMLLPSLLLWFFYNYIGKIESPFLKNVVGPLIITFSLVLGAVVLSLFKDQLGVYSDVDKILEKARITQQDLIREDSYGSNSFDIGITDWTLGGIIRKAPEAIIAGLFRPFIWEARNPVVFISALENTLVLLIVLRIFLRTGIVRSFKLIYNEPFILMSMIFTLGIAFSIGLSTANFGALVRYKIPIIPFFMAALYMLNMKSQAFKHQKQYEKAINSPF